MPTLSTDATASLLAALGHAALLLRPDATVLLANARAREWLGRDQVCPGARFKLVPLSASPSPWPQRLDLAGRSLLVEQVVLDPQTWLVRLREAESGLEPGSLDPAQYFEELRTAFEHAYDEIFVADETGRLVLVNPATTKLYGRRPEELIGRAIPDLELLGVGPPWTTPEVLRRKEPVSVLQRAASGREVLVTAVPVFDAAGNVRRVVGTSRDVSELVQLQRDLDQQLSYYRQEVAELRAQLGGGGVVYVSRAMERVLQTAHKVARVDTPVLLLGESGVGKDLIANSIHRWSNRQAGAFVRLNCAALPEQLLESELFGYEEGAFTGARRQGKPGLIEIASGGSLFLNEVGEMSLTLQPKLLQVLETGELHRLGSTRPKQVNVRIIAATNRDLKQMVSRREFREDLFYRLDVVAIEIPPLRERREDIPPLIASILDQLEAKYGRRRLASATADLMLRYSWPGNVRELRNVLERLALLSDGELIPPELLPEAIRQPDVTPVTTLADAVAEVERTLLQRAYLTYKSTYKVAKVLGISQPTVVRKLQRYGLPAR